MGPALPLGDIPGVYPSLEAIPFKGLRFFEIFLGVDPLLVIGLTPMCPVSLLLNCQNWPQWRHPFWKAWNLVLGLRQENVPLNLFEQYRSTL